MRGSSCCSLMTLRSGRYSEEGIKILYHLIKLRDDLGTSTLFSCQYSPDEWGKAAE